MLVELTTMNYDAVERSSFLLLYSRQMGDMSDREWSFVSGYSSPVSCLSLAHEGSLHCRQNIQDGQRTARGRNDTFGPSFALVTGRDSSPAARRTMFDLRVSHSNICRSSKYVLCAPHWKSSNLFSRKPGRCHTSSNVAFQIFFIGFHETYLLVMDDKRDLRNSLYATYRL